MDMKIQTTEWKSIYLRFPMDSRALTAPWEPSHLLDFIDIHTPPNPFWNFSLDSFISLHDRVLRDFSHLSYLSVSLSLSVFTSAKLEYPLYDLIIIVPTTCESDEEIHLTK